MLPLRGVLLALVVTLSTAGTALAQAGAGGVSVYFLRGEQLARVSRPGASPADAVRQLIAGPTAAERTREYRTYVPAGTRLLSVNIANGVATVDLNAAFTAGDGMSKLARLSQLVRTLTGVQGATQVQLLIDGQTVDGVFSG